MKKCTYCGKEYGDEASACAIDGEPLAKFPPEPEAVKVEPCDEEKIVTIEIFASRGAAEIAFSKLEAHGVECWIKADDAGGMYPNLALASGVRLQVRASDAERAVEVLKTEVSLPETFESVAITKNTSTPSPKTKLAFGQIIIGIIIGVLLTLLYQWTKIEGTKTYYHYAANGQPDEMWIYQDGYLAEYRQDRNLDGKWDHRAYYEKGKVVRAESDDNFDGKPDAWWTYSDDGIDTCQRDTDFNGTPDEFSTYKKRILQGVEIKPNGSKFAITKEIFSNGVLTEIWRGGDSNGNFRTVEKYDAFFNPISTNQLQLQSPLK
jgi:hypothetical protein